MSHFADSDLIARVLLDDDRNAYGQLVRRHSPLVRSLLRKLTGGDHPLADDLAQETFIKAYRNLSAFKGEASFSTWLYRIATNLFLSHRRKKKRRAEASVGPHGPAASATPGPNVDQTKALHIDIEKAMNELSDRERAAISLCYFRGLSHTAAAEVLGCPVGTIKSLILRGKNKLRPQLAAWRPSFSGR
jgi:RNA polymerase sigma-70 factor (ECF subfamily)